MMHPQDQRARADDVDPARVHHRHRRAPARRVGREQVVGHGADPADGDPRAVDRARVVVGQVRARSRRPWSPMPARPTSVRGVGDRHVGARPRRAPRRCRPRRAAISAGGRRVGVQVPLGHADAADVDRAGRPHPGRRRRGRTRSSRRRCRPPGTGPRGDRAPRRDVREAVAPMNDSPASSSPVITSGVVPERRCDHAREVGAVGGVAAWRRRRDHPHPRRRPSSRACAAYSASTTPGALDRLGREPAGPVDALAEPDDLHPPEQIGLRGPPAGSRRPAGGSSWCRSRSRRPGSRLPRVGCAQGPAAHHSPSRSTARSPIGFTPRPRPARAPASTCRHLTRSGIPPAVIRDRQHVAERVPGGEVGLVRGRYRRGELGVGGQLVLPLAHQPGRLEPARPRPSRAGRSGSTASGRRAVLAAAARSRPRRAGRRGTDARPRRGRAAAGRAAGRRVAVLGPSGSLIAVTGGSHRLPSARTDSSSPSYQGGFAALAVATRTPPRGRAALPSTTITSRSPGST